MVDFALNQCTRETVELATWDGPERKPAWRYGDLACHTGVASLSDVWVITHLPTGLSFSTLGVFADVDACAATMLEIAKLKNDWTDIEPDDLPRLSKMLRPIFAKHNAIPRLKRLDQNASSYSREAMGHRLNGYSAPTPLSRHHGGEAWVSA